MRRPGRRVSPRLSGSGSRGPSVIQTQVGPVACWSLPRTLAVVIGYLEGIWRHGAVLTTPGIGYRVETPAAPPDGTAVTWWVTTIVRDNDIRLYGFDALVERDLFEALIAVPRVGPQMALAALRDIGPAGIAAAVTARDPGPLTRAKGIGRKAAELIVSTVALPDGVEAAEASPGSELIEVLIEMGFGADEAAAVIAEVFTDHGGIDGPGEADALSQALSLLAERA
jgi:holliday junction DNA helicase RuvA